MSPPTPVYFISHGGPNIMFDTAHPAYTALGNIGLEITQKVLPRIAGGAKGVVVFSAHWQGGRSKVLVNAGEEEGLLYDFYGFPDHYYKEKFPYKGSRELAEKVLGLLGEKGIEAEGVKRGLDHGVWAGFKCMFPSKNPLTIPIVQVSLFDSESPTAHYSLGQAISALRSQGYLIICSGMAVHNLRDLRFLFGTNKVMEYVATFDEALREAVVDGGIGEERRKKMEEMLRREDARKAHPTFEHLLPVFVAAGAAEGEGAQRTWTLGEWSMSWAQFRFGEVGA
ncbi:extradiol ring-cleavage dioxygenase [Tirmania nivea]|nr:extradiol ring-cleavage dioxygenase [Tirmania nivea]